MSRANHQGRTARSMGRIGRIGHIGLIGLTCLISLASCVREPPLHLYDWDLPAVEVPIVELQLDVYWDYELNLGIDYDWRAEWYYGQNGRWDDEDRRIFGELEYKEPTKFFLRRYFTGDNYMGTRYRKDPPEHISTRTFRSKYDWGYWDILVWNDIETIDNVQSLHFDEKASLDEDITAYTNPTMNTVRYHAPRYQNSFYEPEQLFSACERGIEINQNLDGFVFNAEENVWVRKLKMLLEPITYIYLPQVILHHNNGRIMSAPGIANLSGMARTTNINTGVAGTDPIAVNFTMRMKKNLDMKGETVDIVGGRLMTFGICGLNANRVSRAEENPDLQHHYLDVQMQFNNGIDSTFVFDVTSQVRKRYKGGVITVELDVDTVPIPQRPGGSAFNAVVKDYEDGGTHEFEM